MTSGRPALREISRDLWCCEYPLRLLGIEIGHRMTVIRLPSGGLLLHSPVPIDEVLEASLAEIGPVRYIAAPSLFHDTWIPRVRAHYPDAQFYAAPGFPNKTPPVARAPTDLTGALPEEIRSVITVQLVEGMPKVNEVLFLHGPSRSLIVADLVFNVGAEMNALSRAFFKIYGGYGRVAPSRLYRFMISDQAAMRRSLGHILDWDFDRLIPGHGSIVETGGRDSLRSAYGV